MLRGLLALALAVSTVSVAACAKPSGVDGQIRDEWPAMAEPTGWTPQAEVCYSAVDPVLKRIASGTGECSQLHQAEIVHVGQFTDTAGMNAPPGAGSPAYLKAWAECDAQTTRYLGGAWRERRVRVGVALPTDAAWEGGARWFACQASVKKTVGGKAIYVNYSVKGRFDSEPELSYGCLQVETGGAWTSKRCDEAHNSEFAGTFAWDTSFADAERELKADGSSMHLKCRETVGSFVGASVRTGTYVWLPTKADWDAGDKSVRCFFWLPKNSVSRSMRGVGRAAWPLK